MPVLTNGLVVMTPSTVDKTGTGSTATINSNGSVTFASCATLSLNGVFTSSYDNYMIVVRHRNPDSSGWILYGRLRTSGTNATGTADYNSQWLTADTTVISGARRTADGFWWLSQSGTTNRYGMTMYLFGPYLSQPTAFRTTTATGDNLLMDVAGTHELSTSYDGLTIYPQGGTSTGLVTVFGFNQ